MSQLRLTVYLVVVGVLGCIVIFVVRMLPQEATIPGLATCGDRLCYFDIVPGKTTFEDAKRTIENHLDTSGYKPSQTIYNDLALPDYSGSYDVTDGPIYAIDLYQETGWITGITLYFREDPNLAKFIAFLGQPTSVTIRRTIAQWVNYPSGSLVLHVWDAPIAANTPVLGIYLSSNDEFSGACDTVARNGYGIWGYPLPPC